MSEATERAVLSGALHRSPGSESEPTHTELLSTERKVRLGFAFALACLAVIGVVSYLSVVRLKQNAAWVEHTHQVLGSLELLLAAATDSETAERGYVITGDEDYLEPYRQAAAVIDSQMRHLRELTADNRAQQLRLDSVMALVTERLANLTAVIDLRKDQGFAAAQGEILTGKGKQFHDRIRRLIGQMEDTETSLLKEREQRTKQSSALAQAVIFGGGFLACGLVSLALWAIRRDFAGRARADRALRDAKDQLELRVRQRTAELEKAGEKLQAQLARLHLLHQITRAIGERQDIQSIFQVVIRTLEEHLPVDFCCICLYDPAENCVIVTSVGSHSETLAMELAMTARARVEIDQNGLSQCVQGRLVYEPDITQVPFPFAQRLARGALTSMVAAPLLVESKVFGVLIAARRQAHSFSSGECEFLRQASEHVALAAHQAQLYSALQQAYDDLRQTQKAVMQQERLLALGQMASGIAHDINNAISPVTLYTESLLEKEPGLSPGARSQLETIQRAIDDVAQTVARMREFYRQREPQMTLLPVDMNRLVQQVVDLTRARWSDMAQQRGIAIETRTELAPELPSVMGADNEIREALTNLIFNAVDAMPNGGPLILRTRVAQEQGLPSQESPVRRFVRVEVIDAGIGMDEDTRRRCLEPFFTTKGERGTGLGLAMVYGTMQRHSADFEIESALGKGTTVRMSFAIPTTPAVGVAASATASAVPPLRILIVDDDPLVLKSLRDTLEADGHGVTTADGGRAGIDAFLAAKAQGNPFPVVITDLGMPYVDGRKVSNAIKTAAPQTILLLLTGWGQRLVADGDVPPHVDRVLSKPPKLRELREALARCWDAQAS
ncbi:MAG TPA: CHASE3 domain-containing protein [Steroidobacteraceae bacterium]|nr:CHASE3 domain-containing protein [Steroidobacteraceae bacterium]